ncbi:Mitochondrial-associated sphingomyelin phosphodiesterase [Popillia japonica]|uniref:Mitochondrial-associated sphingomyelin phosphodiesterase n=1 Tax=Popillia japonica TaxID=7064 RepID=A0AAW1JX27_POPJA
MDSDVFMNQISLALSKPIQQRCADLAILFQRGSLRDLQAIFPLLVDNIFGPQGTLSWGLRSITITLKSHDFHTLQQFLSPCGPFFQLIYGLLKDPFIKYDFSVAFLPTKLRQMFESSKIHPFYADLIHINPQNKQVTWLTLNPFDYYMFHFAYHLINPWHQRSGIPLRSSWSTVYYILCCDYVLHFLPTTVGAVILPVINYNGKNPIQHYQQQVVRPPTKVSKLLKTNLFGEVPSEYTPVLQPLEKHPRSEIWRSETILTVFLDMWLNNDQISHSFENNFNITSSKQPLHFNELPAGEYIRIIRVLVKQLHGFASSGKVDDSNLGELKKITLPMMQGKMYIFLRNLVHRWPLDGSFRLVLELWLSFIQPWRYPGYPHTKLPPTQPEVHPDMDDNTNTAVKAVDREYLQFIAENILAYVVIFQQLLPRFLRVDLASPKNSLMLYRLTKVYDQPNLVSLIREIEYCIENNDFSPTHGFNMPNTMPPLSPTSKWSSNTGYFDPAQMKSGPNSTFNASARARSFSNTKYSGIVRQKINELEGPNFCFKPLFAGAAAQEVFELIGHIRKAECTAENVIRTRLQEIEKNYSGVMGFLKSLVLSGEHSTDEFTLEERKKVPLYLNFSLQYLTDMFQITEPANINQDITPETSFTNQHTNITDNSLDSLLTPKRVMERKKTITYEGDPDLHPIRSNEFKLLVRMFYHWASKLNEKYLPLICQFYYREDFTGRFARQIIMKPITIYRYDKSISGKSPRISEHLPPRISFRRFASHQFVAYVVIAILINQTHIYEHNSFNDSTLTDSF